MKKLTETLIGATEQRKKHLIVECNNRIEILDDSEKRIQVIKTQKQYYEQGSMNVDKRIADIEDGRSQSSKTLECQKKELRENHGYDYDEERRKPTQDGEMNMGKG